MVINSGNLFRPSHFFSVSGSREVNQVGMIHPCEVDDGARNIFVLTILFFITTAPAFCDLYLTGCTSFKTEYSSPS